MQTHLGLNHVDSSGAQSFDTVVDVHHPFSLCHVQHDVNHDVTSRPAGSRTETYREGKQIIIRLI